MIKGLLGWGERSGGYWGGGIRGLLGRGMIRGLLRRGMIRGLLGWGMIRGLLGWGGATRWLLGDYGGNNHIYFM